MKPCKACLKQYGEFLCTNLGHCVFEDSGEWLEVPSSESENTVLVEHTEIPA